MKSNRCPAAREQSRTLRWQTVVAAAAVVVVLVLQGEPREVGHAAAVAVGAAVLAGVGLSRGGPHEGTPDDHVVLLARGWGHRPRARAGGHHTAKKKKRGKMDIRTLLSC